MTTAYTPARPVGRPPRTTKRICVTMRFEVEELAAISAAATEAGAEDRHSWMLATLLRAAKQKRR